MPSDLGARLRALGLALINATLLLAVLLLVLALLLVVQVRGLAEDVRTGVRVDLAAMHGEVQAARAEARAALEALDDPARAAAAREDLRALVGRLDALEAREAAGPATTPDEADSALRELVLAIVARVARGLLGEAGEAPAR